MNRFMRSFVVLAVLAVLAAAAAPVQATWFYSHGGAAIIQLSSLANVASYEVYGWGLDVTVKKGKSIWVHVPFSNWAQDGITANEIQLIWWASSKTIYVSSAHVYDGSVRFWTKDGNWKGYSGTASYTSTNWSLGRDWNIYRGFGLSFQITNKGAADQKVIIASAGVHFEDR